MMPFLLTNKIPHVTLVRVVRLSCNLIATWHEYIRHAYTHTHTHTLEHQDGVHNEAVFVV